MVRLCRLCFALLLVYSSSTTATVSKNNWTYMPETVVLINCGATGNQTDPDDREWHGDVGFALPSFLDSNRSTVATAVSQLPSIRAVPYMTARIFTDPATYTIPVVGERVFVRLYFYPAGYGVGLSASDAVFDVTAERQALLRNFTPAWDAAALRLEYIDREYSLNVSDSGFVSLTFTPYPGSYAFINGIEVVSMPDIFTPKLDSLEFVGFGVSFELSPSTALETMYRLNVGGGAVSLTDDSGLFRRWDDDSLYIFGAAFGLTRSIDPNIALRYPLATPRFIAPDSVYSTQRSMTGSVAINRQSNLTWALTVDPGFYYLVRLHFCDIQTTYNRPNERVFSIYINNETAEGQADVFAWATLLVGSVQQGSGLGVPFYKDYITAFPNGPEQVELRLDIHPNDFTEPEYVDAVLNGLEIFKINNHSDGSLAGVKPTLWHSTTVPEQRNKRGYNKVGIIMGEVMGGIVVLSAGLLLLLCWRRWRQSSRAARKGCESNFSSRCYHFTFDEIVAATNGFDESCVIGVGGFGKVYKGVIRTDSYNGGVGFNSTTPTSRIGETIEVAIKHANPMSGQGVREFLNEIEKLSQLRHKHLVSLIGFCDEHGEMILVYDYMANGTLREHLYNQSGKPTLTWKQRLEICVGVARGLHYLHVGHGIIHRDVKTTNILMNEEWIPKVADFGLSKVGPGIGTHVSTEVMGTYGYLDPEYCRRMQLTDKSDVYSFGVVLFEVFCGRSALNDSLPPRQKNLANWVRHCYQNGFMVDIMDKKLKGQIAPQCFTKYVDIAYKCISLRRVKRPSIGAVLSNLESALKIQQVIEVNESFEGVGVSYIPKLVTALDTSTTSTVSIASSSVDSVNLEGHTHTYQSLPNN